MKNAIAFLLTIMPGTLLAQGSHAPISEPFHTLSHSGHIIGAVIIVAALIAFFRQRDER